MNAEETDVLIEVMHNYRAYFVPESVLKSADALQMPDGTLLDLRRTGIEHDTTRTPHRHRLIGANHEYEVCGTFPTLKVVEAPESAQKPN